MEKKNYEKLLKRLESEELRLLDTHPVPDSVGLPHSTGILIHTEMDISKVPEEKIPLVHSMLHMFYHSKGGKGLTKEDIVVLHGDVKKRIKEHKYFDELDKNGIY